MQRDREVRPVPPRIVGQRGEPGGVVCARRLGGPAPLRELTGGEVQVGQACPLVRIVQQMHRRIQMRHRVGSAVGQQRAADPQPQRVALVRRRQGQRRLAYLVVRPPVPVVVTDEQTLGCQGIQCRGHRLGRGAGDGREHRRVDVCTNRGGRGEHAADVGRQRGEPPPDQLPC